MAKHKKTMKPSSPELPPPSAELTPRGKALIGAGGVLVVAGFVALTFADPLGRNAASVASPLLLLAGYASVGFGLFLTD